MKLGYHERLALERRLRVLDLAFEKLPHLHLSPDKAKAKAVEIRKEMTKILDTLEAAGEE